MLLTLIFSDKLRHTNILRCYLGLNKVYFVIGAQNVQAMFRTSNSISSDKFMIFIMENLWGSTQEDLAKFANDKSGRLSTPAHGAEKTPEKERYWASFHRLVHNYLARTHEANMLARTYERLFAERLERFPLHSWSTVRILDFLRKDMTESAIVSLVGSRILELSPDLLEVFWDFDEIVASIAWGPPKWLKREAWKRRDRLRARCARYLEAAWADFDWSGPEADADWEPKFGARYSRELAKWMKEIGLSPVTSAGIVAVTSIFAYSEDPSYVLVECARLSAANLLAVRTGTLSQSRHGA